MTSRIPEERHRATVLHQRKVRGETLTGAEESLVARFYQVVEAEETELLAPALRRMDEQIAAEAERRERLQRLLERQKASYAGLQKMVAETQ